ncbi:hypothetical protein EQG63_07130 [Flavobacterium amnicola]|uniref:Vitamin uptake-like sensor domain-containing protein n=1 Tax=Flavobacterium amnicola TaxID=2506422 RepID=A0A4Q1K3Q4_9FLAO|nr:hypothetical protein [Flavobacterium amnicola]RXR19212.1 hypothetical protein EQG63_07130 [Flavobacterium amnicola]
MNALSLLIFEIVIISGAILFLHKLRNHLGIGLLLIFLGTVQFYQTVLASSVYNEIFDGVVVSPGSAILFTSTLFSVLLIFHTEGVKVTRTAIFGVLLSNVLLSILSIITLYQLKVDDFSVFQDYLNEILNFDVTLFLIGTCLLLFDLFLIVIIYQFLNLKLKMVNTIFKIYIPLSLVALFDSVMFYGINFFSIETNLNLLFSNVIGKQIATLLFSIFLFFYLKFSKLLLPREIPNNLDDVIAVFTFDDNNAK